MADPVRLPCRRMVNGRQTTRFTAPYDEEAHGVLQSAHSDVMRRLGSDAAFRCNCLRADRLFAASASRHAIGLRPPSGCSHTLFAMASASARTRVPLLGNTTGSAQGRPLSNREPAFNCGRFYRVASFLFSARHPVRCITRVKPPRPDERLPHWCGTRLPQFSLLWQSLRKHTPRPPLALRSKGFLPRRDVARSAHAQLILALWRLASPTDGRCRLTWQSRASTAFQAVAGASSGASPRPAIALAQVRVIRNAELRCDARANRFLAA